MSNSPQKQAAPTSASQWKKSSGFTAQPLQVPSGHTALVRVPGVDVFFKAGIIPNNLKAIIQNAIAKGEAPDIAEMQKEAQSNPKMLEDILELVNAVTVYSVVEPKVHPDTWTQEDVFQGLCTPEQVGEKIPFAERSDSTLYVDEVDLEDRMFIMQLAFGGTRDLEQFRRELEGNVESSRPRKSAPRQTKRTGGAKKR